MWAEVEVEVSDGQRRWIEVTENDGNSKQTHVRLARIVPLKDDGSGTMAIMAGIESCRKHCTSASLKRRRVPIVLIRREINPFARNASVRVAVRGSAHDGFHVQCRLV